MTIKISYDPKIVSYSELLEKYWVSIDPTVKDKQFCKKDHNIERAYTTP